MGHKHPDRRLHAWERFTAYPLTALSVLFIAVYAWPILDPNMDEQWRSRCEVTDLLVWAIFTIEYVVRLLLAEHKTKFVSTHWFDLAVLVLPVLRPLRVLRLLNALRMINRHAVHWTRGRLAVYVVAASLLIIFVGGLAVLDVERGRPESVIETYPEALWWTVCTITTVGYGDLYPVTLEGRLIAAALMVGGLGLLGFVTGSLSSWIVDRISTADRPTGATRGDVKHLLHEIRALREEVAQLRAERQGAPAGDDGLQRMAESAGELAGLQERNRNLREHDQEAHGRSRDGGGGGGGGGKSHGHHGGDDGHDGGGGGDKQERGKRDRTRHG